MHTKKKKFILISSISNVWAVCMEIIQFNFKLNEVVILIIDSTLTFKAPAKMHLKMSSAELICFIYLLTSLTNVSLQANSVDPDQMAPSGAVNSR